MNTVTAIGVGIKIILLGLICALLIMTNSSLVGIAERLDHPPVVECPVSYDVQINDGAKLILIDRTGSLDKSIY